MIVPALILAMQAAGLGKVNTDLFWEELPTDPRREGVWVVSRGDAGSDENAQRLQVDIYARYSNKVTTELKLRDIVNWVRGDAQNLCVLSVDPADLDGTQQRDTITYDIVSIKHTGAIQNQGIDDNFRILKAITIEIKYNERIKSHEKWANIL